MSTLTTLLAKLGDRSQPFKHRDLRGLSDLDSEKMAELLAGWETIGVERRRALVGAMRTLAEDNVEFDFRNVLSMVLEDPDPEVRQVAVDGLWEDQRPRTMRRLIELLDTDPDERVRASAALTLGHWAYLGELGELRDEHSDTVRRALIKTAGDTSSAIEVRRRAVESAGYFSGDDVTEVIKQAYATGQQQLKESALAAIGHNLDDRWLPILRVELASAVAALRYEAARATGEYGEAATPLLAALVPLVDDDDAEVAQAATWSLGQIGGSGAERTLERLIKSGPAALQQLAEEALSELHFNVDPGRLF